MEQCHIDGCTKQDGHTSPHRFDLTRDYHSCYNTDGIHKRGYTTRRDAKHAIKSMRATGARGDLSVYLGDCGQWHVGNGTMNDLVIALDKSLAARARLRAISEGVGISELVRRALDYYMDTP